MKSATSKNEGSEKKLIAPDGGWGWVIVFASALSNVIIIPIMQSFGLLFKDRFISMGMSATDCSIIINVNSAFGMGLGLINGPLLRRFSYRKVAMAGTTLVFIGVTGLTWARSFVDFLILYSLITSLGITFTLSSFSLALNTYFRERRSKAAGFAMTATGFGPIVMPQLISLLMQHYGVSGTVSLLGAISLHSFMAALLLQPVKWHMKPAPPDGEEDAEEVDDDDDNDDVASTGQESVMIAEARPTRRRYRTITNTSDYDDIDTRTMYGFETPLMDGRKYSVTSESQMSRGRPRMALRSISQVDEPVKPVVIPIPLVDYHYQEDHWWSPSVETINLGSSVAIFLDQQYAPLAKSEEASTNANRKISKIQFSGRIENDDLKEENIISITKKKQNIFMRIGTKIFIFFDFDLLRDPGYVSLMLGSAIAACAELNFSLLTPFIMADLGFTTREIATIMSTIAGADIVFRFISPYIGDWFKASPHVMYTIGLCFMTMSRTALIFVSGYRAVLSVCVLLGIAKGFRTVYMFLVIPSYVPLERLASASGIQMVSNGLLVIILGPLLGAIRDWTGSYSACIAAVNCMTMVTVTMWTIHLLISRHRRKQEIAKTADST